ncbi:J domain-containing protein [Noviherbaspirillum galbum]|uniref:J domain-containing protein n=1 Tax=Noviherbaspirillum galbum TaxID=2709383 RepID=A0A6B3SPI1_9BURK|nr:J domain-containing protein [Noviherbaspirillum galbum]
MGRIHTHYDNLKVARNAPPEVIRAAYKTLSQKYHPDRNPGNKEAIRIIQIINSAYEVLSDPVKRKEHDDWIAQSEAGSDRNRSGSGFRFSPDPVESSRSSAMYRRTRSSSRRSRREHSVPTPADMIHQLRAMVYRFTKFFFRKA